MRPGQSLSQLTSRLLTQLETHFSQNRPDLILAHGDTTTSFATAVSSFYHQIPFYHVEAGLRTHRLNSPFPEEFNRQSIAPIAHHHFAPTEIEKENLLLDGISPCAITVTGSTLHEAVSEMQLKLKSRELPFDSQDSGRPIVVVTLHRRESSNVLETTLIGLKNSALLQREALFICPVHPNPNVQKAFQAHLSGVENVVLTTPLEYPQFISLLLKARLVVTDSGGVQEEAAFLGKPVLLARQETERLDGIDSGLVQIMGLKPGDIINSISRHLSNPQGDCGSDFTKRAREKASEVIAHEVKKVV
ncbi:MAG: non-hydrolyzing UDP-N-acetylglucosamine 2-epimerase [Pseudobdellovibrionaceae bacterium]